MLLLPAAFAGKQDPPPLEPYPFNERHLLVVTSFNDETREKKFASLGTRIADQLINEIFQYNRYRLIERNQFKALLDELNFQQSGYLDKENASRIGKMLGAELMLVGSLTELSEKQKKRSVGFASTKKTVVNLAMEARVVLMETGEIVAISSWSGEQKKSRKQALMAVSENQSGIENLIDRALEEGIRHIAYEICRSAPRKNQAPKTPVP